MQENNEQSKNVSSESSSKSKKSKKKEPKKKKRFFSEHRSEFKKITWPNRKTLVKQTITVIFISLIVGVIIFVYDLGIDLILENLIKLMA